MVSYNHGVGGWAWRRKVDIESSDHWNILGQIRIGLSADLLVWLGFRHEEGREARRVILVWFCTSGQ